MSTLFNGASASALRTLAGAFRSGQLTSGVSKLWLSRVCPCPDEVADTVCRLAREGMSAPHLAILLETSAEAIEARMESAAELVWTGPEAAVSHSRDTAIVVSELFGSAMQSVLVSTFVVRQAAVVFKPLAERMAQVPGLRVQLFVHVGRDLRDTRHESEILREFATDLRKQWPGDIRPLLYFDPRALATNPQDRATWHAKVVVVDDEVSFVTSANFTEWAQGRNVEAGVLVRDAAFARQLRQQFDGLVQSKAVLEVPGFRA